jgi:hypothetical protein
MRAISCAAEPNTVRRLEAALVDLPESDMWMPENLNFSAGVLGNLAATEAFKSITGAGDYFAAGGILVVDVHHGRFEKHIVLRMPQCKSCCPAFPPAADPGIFL